MGRQFDVLGFQAGVPDISTPSIGSTARSRRACSSLPRLTARSRCRPSSPRRRHRSPPSPRWQSAPHRPRTQRAYARASSEAQTSRSWRPGQRRRSTSGSGCSASTPGRRVPGRARLTGVRADDRRGGRRPRRRPRSGRSPGTPSAAPGRCPAAVTSATASDDGGRTPVADRSPRKKEGDDRKPRGGPVVRPAPSPPVRAAGRAEPAAPAPTPTTRFLRRRPRTASPAPRCQAVRTRSSPRRRPALASTAHPSAPVV